MTGYKKIAKCPNCCPDGGACFHADLKDDGQWHWICQNCGHDLGVVRRVQASGRLTKSQRRVIRWLRREFGGLARWEMIGRKAYVKLDNPKRPWYDGRMAGGIVGAAGAFKITVYRLGGDATVTDRIGVEVYLRQKALRDKEAERNRKWLDRQGRWMAERGIVTEVEHVAGGCV